jgi:hypothetical protein
MFNYINKKGLKQFIFFFNDTATTEIYTLNKHTPSVKQYHIYTAINSGTFWTADKLNNSYFTNTH